MSNIESALRALRKMLIQISRRFLIEASVALRFSGARVSGETQCGNTVLTLNRDTALGRLGFTLEIPRDSVIYESVRQSGTWELEESRFIASNLTRMSKKGSHIAILDIGANTGLVSLQALNLSRADCSVFLFEPLPSHAYAINYNLRNFPKVTLNNFALSDHNGSTKIYTQYSNRGNTSLFKSVVPPINQITTEISLVDTEQYFNHNFQAFDHFLLKCDTQGMDALILSRVPSTIWDRVSCAVIEVWSLAEIVPHDVEKTLDFLDRFEFVSWDPRIPQKISAEEISEFWLSKSGMSRNLFVRQ